MTSGGSPCGGRKRSIDFDSCPAKSTPASAIAATAPGWTYPAGSLPAERAS